MKKEDKDTIDLIILCAKIGCLTLVAGGLSVLVAIAISVIP